MKFWYKGHHYKTDFKFYVTSRLSKWFGSYRYPVAGGIIFPHYECTSDCTYWTAVDSPAGRRAFMLDDELSITKDKSKP